MGPEQPVQGVVALMRCRLFLEMVLVDHVEIVQDATGRSHLGVIGSGGRQHVARDSFLEEVGLILHLQGKLIFHVHQTQVGTKGLVEGEHVYVGVELLEVREAVGRPAYTVHHRKGTVVMGQGGDLPDRVDLPDHIGAMGKGHHLGPCREQRFQLLKAE